MNCSRNKFEPYNKDESSQLQQSFVTDICPNGAANFPTCTTTAFGNCVNGNSNPPACTTGGSSKCGNGAVDYPTCSLTSTGSCVNGTVNPPDCNSFAGNNNCSNGATNYPKCDIINTSCSNGSTNFPICDNNNTCPNGAVNPPNCTTTKSNICIDGSTNPPICDNGTGTSCSNSAVNAPNCTVDINNKCVNGNTNPPDCTIAPVARVFDVIENISGSLSAYSVKIDMQFNEADIHQKGAIFLFGILGSRIIVCTNPCTPNSTWKEWNNAIYDWSTTGLRTEVGVSSSGIEGLQTILNMVSFDATTLGGYKIYAGYGKGNDVNSAINEMLGFRSTSLPNGRYLEVLTVPTQNRNITIAGPGGSSPGPLTSYNLWTFMHPSYLDYGKPGYFFITAQDSTNTQRFVYRQKSLGVYEWVVWDGTIAGLANNYYKYDPTIKNEEFQFINGNVSAYSGWKVYSGYGNGTSAIDAANDCFNNSKFNVTPFTLN